MSIPGEAVPLTAIELSAELMNLGVNETAITQAMQTALSRRAELHEQQGWEDNIRDFMVAYARISGDDPNDHDIGGWFGRFQDSAHGLLCKASQTEELTDQQQRVVRAAGMAYVYHLVEDDGIKGPVEEAELQGLLGSAKVNLFRIRDRFREAYTESQTSDAIPVTAEGFDTFRNMASFWDGTPALWTAVMAPTVGAVYDELKQSGFVLPELGADGLYDEER